MEGDERFFPKLTDQALVPIIGLESRHRKGNSEMLLSIPPSRADRRGWGRGAGLGVEARWGIKENRECFEWLGGEVGGGGQGPPLLR